jgi:hypothetical protein
VAGLQFLCLHVEVTKFCPGAAIYDFGHKAVGHHMLWLMKKGVLITLWFATLNICTTLLFGHFTLKVETAILIKIQVNQPVLSQSSLSNGIKISYKLP